METFVCHPERHGPQRPDVVEQSSADFVRMRAVQHRWARLLSLYERNLG